MRKVVILGLTCIIWAAAQEHNPLQNPQASDPVSGQTPLYRVNVIERTTQAVNYGHRNQPTPLDFRGTIFAPDAEGEAWIDADRGAVEVKAKLKKLPNPQRFGPRYLTYVLWAVTPEGRAQNLGEVMTNSGGKGKLEVSASLQTFALIVTAEPYYAVTQPSDLVVLENRVRPDTAGSVRTVQAKYELLPRGETTLDLDAARRFDERSTRKISRKHHEALTELYQARSAVQWARYEQAERYAAETLRRAEERLQQAEQQYQADPESERVITLSREAAQTAEDARLIALRKRDAGAERSPLAVNLP